MTSEMTIEAPSEQQLIAMIHQEFDTAPERLLRDAPEKIRLLDDEITKLKNEKTVVDPALSSKVARLSRLGFTNTADSTLLANQRSMDRDRGTHIRFLKTEKDQVQQVSDLVSYYRATYPFATFLTVEELNRICETYGLIHAPAPTFIGEVPEKNLKEIENAQPLKALDLPEKALQAHGGIVNISVHEALAYTKQARRPELFGETIEQLLAYLDRHGDVFNALGINSGAWIHPNLPNPVPWPNIWESSISDFGSAVFEQQIFNARSLRDFQRRIFPAMPEVNMPERETPKTFTIAPIAGFHIAAPPSMFKLDKAVLVKEGKYGYVVNNDPIVFKYCRGGILVYSKWGLEASDPALINPIEN